MRGMGSGSQHVVTSVEQVSMVRIPSCDPVSLMDIEVMTMRVTGGQDDNHRCSGILRVRYRVMERQERTIGAIKSADVDALLVPRMRSR